MCREVFTQSMQQHGGAIVNITMVVENGMPKMSHSAAARAGVTNLTRSLATEWAPNGVRINCVAPGVIFTKSGFENYGPSAHSLVLLSPHLRRHRIHHALVPALRVPRS
eukprot:6651221-Prymnesium_polylepis.1